MIVFVTRTSEPDQNVSPFLGATKHAGTGGWYIEMPLDRFSAWVEAYGPIVACVITMPNGDRAWAVEMYDAPREGDRS